MEQHGFKSKLIIYVVITLLFFAIFYTVYAPVIQKDFYYEQDTAYLGVQGDPANYLDLMKKEGRVINYIGLYYIARYIKSSHSTMAVRFIGVIGIALFASVMWDIFKRFRFRSDHSFLMSALICTLPGMQISFLWINCIPYIYGSWLASLSALIFFNFADKQESECTMHKMIRMAASVFLLVISLSIYQSTAMMYWTVGVIFCLVGNNQDFLKKYRRVLVEFFGAGFTSIVVYYIIFIKLVPLAMNSSIDRASLLTVQMIPVKLAKFIMIPLKNALNLWNVYSSFTVAIFIGAIIFYGIRLNLRKDMKEQEQFITGRYIQKYYVIFVLLILSYLPSLIVPETAYYYRTLLPFGAAVSVMFFFSFINIVEIHGSVSGISAESRKTVITILLVILTVIAAILARYNAVHWFSPAQLDVNLWEKYGF